MVGRPADVVLADPCWAFGDSLPGASRGAAKNYDVLSAEEIARHPLPPISENALLFLWRVSAMPEEALFVARAWGFEPKSEIVWVKTREPTLGEIRLHFGMGRYVRNSHETCIVCSRGRGSSLVLDHGVRSVFFANVGLHSAKPPAFYDLVERMLGRTTHASLRKVEVFARGAPRAGWESYGREAIGSPEHAS